MDMCQVPEFRVLSNTRCYPGPLSDVRELIEQQNILATVAFCYLSHTLMIMDTWYRLLSLIAIQIFPKLSAFNYLELNVISFRFLQLRCNAAGSSQNNRCPKKNRTHYYGSQVFDLPGSSKSRSRKERFFLRPAFKLSEFVTVKINTVYALSVNVVPSAEVDDFCIIVSLRYVYIYNAFFRQNAVL